MRSCPEIDDLVSPAGAHGLTEHLATCGACSAVVVLGRMRATQAAADSEACTEAEARIAALAEGTLRGPEMPRLVAHLKVCEPCSAVASRMTLHRSEQEGATQLVARTEAVAATTSPGLRADGPSPSRRPAAWSARPWALAAATLLLGLGAGWLARGWSSPPSRVVEAPAAAEPQARAAAAPEPPAPEPQAPAPPAPEPSAEVIDPWRSRASKKPRAGSTSRSVEVLDPWGASPPPKKAPKPAVTRDKTGILDPWGSRSPAIGHGYLTVVCDPFCEKVVIDGRSVGPSPVVRHKLATGLHRIELLRQSVKKAISVRIDAGKTHTRRVRMRDDVE